MWHKEQVQHLWGSHLPSPIRQPLPSRTWEVLYNIWVNKCIACFSVANMYSSTEIFTHFTTEDQKNLTKMKKKNTRKPQTNKISKRRREDLGSCSSEVLNGNQHISKRCCSAHSTGSSDIWFYCNDSHSFAEIRGWTATENWTSR